MSALIPAFDWQRVVVASWTTDLATFGWIVLMGFLANAACGLVGNYLLLRRMALMGDAVSHSILPGLVLAFLVSGSRGTGPMFLGALVAGVLAAGAIEAIQQRSLVKQDAAIGITFSTLFAVGVVLTAVFAAQVDLDAECVLFGEIAFVPLEPPVALAGFVLGPVSVVRMAVVLGAVIALIAVFYKELLVSSFDAGLAGNLGLKPRRIHFALMAVLSVVAVSAFEAVGAVLVIAMLILPGATATLLVRRLPAMHAVSVLHAALSAVLGLHLGVWLECSIGAAMVLAGAGLFATAWLFAPRDGLIALAWRRTRAMRGDASGR